MMNFPRFSLILLALSISACGGGGGSDGGSPSSNNTEASTSSDFQSSSGASGIILGSGSSTSGADTSQSDPAQEPDPITNFTVTWVAPVQREDGMPILLSDIAGYKVYTGTTTGFYTANVSVNGSDATSKTFEDFSPGSYFFAVTTLDTEGRESQFSDEIEIVVTN